MGTSAGPNLISDGLVFGYDTGYPIVENDNSTIFSKGKPTTNLVSAYNDNHVRAVTWTNSGTWDYDHNASNNIKPNVPNVDMSKCNLMHGETLTVGSQHFGCSNVGVSASTTYTMSVYYFQNRAGASQPYFRQSVNNNNLGNLAYNGSTNTSNWPVNEWIRISVTVTTAANENACYLSNYLGSQIGDQVWYCAPMVEQASHLSPFVDGTRSSTQSLIDLKETTDISTSNVSFDSNAQMTFDGTDDVIQLSTALVDNLSTSELTVEAIVYHTSWGSTGTSRPYIANWNTWDSTTPNQRGFILRTYGTNQYPSFWYCWGSSYSSISSNTSMNLNQFHHVVGVFKKDSYAKIYLDGVETGTTTSGTSNNLVYDDTTGTRIGYGTINTGRFVGELPIVKVYNKALSAQEVKQNFNAYRKRFGI